MAAAVSSSSSAAVATPAATRRCCCRCCPSIEEEEEEEEEEGPRPRCRCRSLLLPARTEVILPRALESVARLLFSRRPDFFSHFVEELVGRPNPLEENIVRAIAACCAECLRHHGRELLRRSFSIADITAGCGGIDLDTVALVAATFESFAGIAPGGSDEEMEEEEEEEDEVYEEAEGVGEDEVYEEAEGVGEDEGEEEEADVSNDEGVSFDFQSSNDDFNFAWANFMIYMLVMGHLFDESVKKLSPEKGTVSTPPTQEELLRTCLYDEQNLFRVIARSATKSFKEKKLIEYLEPKLGWKGFLHFDYDRLTTSLKFKDWFIEKLT